MFAFMSHGIATCDEAYLSSFIPLFVIPPLLKTYDAFDQGLIGL